jgi:hypothetical protein
MLDRLAHHTFSFGEESATEIDAVKPRLQSLQFRQDFLTRHLKFSFYFETKRERLGPSFFKPADVLID